MTAELAAGVARLVPQVSSSAPGPTEAELREIVGSAGTVLFVARHSGGEDGRVVGMLTLVTYRIPTGLHAVIEDVVVDESTRGAGVGAGLVAAALAEAASRGARNVDLTSRPGREAANGLYQKMGFARRETNVYRYPLR
ncbi:MAG: GNAT family N-acetyltransferase [Acidimicrobiales bacterium]